MNQEKDKKEDFEIQKESKVKEIGEKIKLEGVCNCSTPPASNKKNPKVSEAFPSIHHQTQFLEDKKKFDSHRFGPKIHSIRPESKNSLFEFSPENPAKFREKSKNNEEIEEEEQISEMSSYYSKIEIGNQKKDFSIKSFYNTESIHAAKEEDDFWRYERKFNIINRRFDRNENPNFLTKSDKQLKKGENKSSKVEIKSCLNKSNIQLNDLGFKEAPSPKNNKRHVHFHRKVAVKEFKDKEEPKNLFKRNYR